MQVGPQVVIPPMFVVEVLPRLCRLPYHSLHIIFPERRVSAEQHVCNDSATRTVKDPLLWLSAYKGRYLRPARSTVSTVPRLTTKQALARPPAQDLVPLTENNPSALRLFPAREL